MSGVFIVGVLVGFIAGGSTVGLVGILAILRGKIPHWWWL